MKDAITGVRVKISIDEDGTDSPPILPPGTIVGKVIGTDMEPYHLVRLDHPVVLARDHSVETLFDLVLGPKFKGGNMERLLEIPYDTFIPVGIAKVLSPIASDDPVLEFSKVDYFAVGRVSRIRD
jgi:hypothetical protein